MRPSQTILVLEELRDSLAVPLRRKGAELSLGDNRLVMDVYQQWLALLLDLGYLHPPTLRRTCTRLLSDMVKADVLDLVNACAKCLDLIRVQDFKGFKALCKRISPHLYSLVRSDKELVLLGDVRAARRLMQAFAYMTRMSLRDIDLTQQMLDEYMAVEDQMIDVPHKSIVERLNRVMRRWLRSFDPNQIRPRHGNGGVSGYGRKATLEIKYKDLSSDMLLEYAFGAPWWSAWEQRMTRQSQTKFVAKSYKTFRTISMEPATLMYFQQGVWDVLDKLVRCDPYLRARIDFHDQDRNKLLAQRGSIGRDYATIDLSAASDSVSYNLVKGVFKGTPLLRYLVATRSKTTLLPDGRVITMKKFAPMGSALCFPIETLIFAAICEIVMGEVRDHRRYSVYGDDIIIPTERVGSLINVLEKLGFRVNREKSFYLRTHWFRESCGGEYCDGYDVTPIRVSRKYAHRELDVQVDTIVKLANNAYKRGYRNLRMFFIRRLRTLGIAPLFSPDYLLADNYSNYHTVRRWRKDLHRIEVKVTDFASKYEKQALRSQDEFFRLRHWFESTYDRIAIGDGFESIVCRPAESKQEAWRMKPFEPIDQGYIDFYKPRSKRNT